jgi:hypothetical protein
LGPAGAVLRPPCAQTTSGCGGAAGGGAGGAVSAQTGGEGAVRIIWSGTSGIVRAFPSTNVGDL